MPRDDLSSIARVTPADITLLTQAIQSPLQKEGGYEVARANLIRSLELVLMYGSKTNEELDPLIKSKFTGHYGNILRGVLRTTRKKITHSSSIKHGMKLDKAVTEFLGDMDRGMDYSLMGAAAVALLCTYEVGWGGKVLEELLKNKARIFDVEIPVRAWLGLVGIAQNLGMNPNDYIRHLQYVGVPNADKILVLSQGIPGVSKGAKWMREGLEALTGITKPVSGETALVAATNKLLDGPALDDVAQTRHSIQVATSYLFDHPLSALMVGPIVCLYAAQAEASSIVNTLAATAVIERAAGVSKGVESELAAQILDLGTQQTLTTLTSGNDLQAMKDILLGDGVEPSLVRHYLENKDAIQTQAPMRLKLYQMLLAQTQKGKEGAGRISADAVLTHNEVLPILQNHFEGYIRVMEYGARTSLEAMHTIMVLGGMATDSTRALVEGVDSALDTVKQKVIQYSKSNPLLPTANNNNP